MASAWNVGTAGGQNQQSTVTAAAPDLPGLDASSSMAGSAVLCCRGAAMVELGGAIWFPTRFGCHDWAPAA